MFRQQIIAHRLRFQLDALACKAQIVERLPLLDIQRACKVLHDARRVIAAQQHQPRGLDSLLVFNLRRLVHDSHMQRADVFRLVSR